jgi:3-methyladenine DNA glycosylase AlkD
MKSANVSAAHLEKIHTASEALSALRTLGDPARAQHHQRFFKMGEGQYGHGDQFLGVTVPQSRALVRRCQLPLNQMWTLLQSPWHEARLLALFLLVRAFPKSDAATRQLIYQGYLEHTAFINNWDLVDSSAPQIVGAHLFAQKTFAPLKKLARSKSLWERRIAMLASYHFTLQGDFSPTLDLAQRLLQDTEDLLHKAVGWMLREMGGRGGAEELRQFLATHAAAMPRTMLRYAIEKLPAPERAHYSAMTQNTKLK